MRLQQHTLMRPEKSRTEIFPCRKSVMADFRGKVPVDIPYKYCKRIHTSFPDQDGCLIFKERLTVPSDERSRGTGQWNGGGDGEERTWEKRNFVTGILPNCMIKTGRLSNKLQVSRIRRQGKESLLHWVLRRARSQRASSRIDVGSASPDTNPGRGGGCSCASQIL